MISSPFNKPKAEDRSKEKTEIFSLYKTLLHFVINKSPLFNNTPNISSVRDRRDNQEIREGNSNKTVTRRREGRFSRIFQIFSIQPLLNCPSQFYSIQFNFQLQQR